MFCPSCGSGVQPGQKFCTECGAPLAAVAAAAPSTADPSATPPPGVSLPPPNLAPPVVPGVTSTASTAPAPTAGADLYDATAALTVVEQTAPTGYDPDAWDETPTGQLSAQGGDTGVVSAVQAFRFTPLLAVSALAAVLAVAVAFVNVASIDVTGDLQLSQVFKLNDFASNVTVGAIIAAVLLVGGAAVGATGRHLGSGLAGGAGLALAGMMGMTIGQVIARFDSQEVALLNGGRSFTLTTTQEIGFWLAAGAAVLGLLAFALSVTSAGKDRFPAINPAIGVLGALGTLAVVVGPLIPMNSAGLGDNFTNEFVPPATLYLRLAVLLLIGIGGLVGFLANRRWGIGIALGAISIGAWQWVTALAEWGDQPYGIAGGNPGAVDFAPHIVTTVGVIAMLLAAVVGLVAAAQQRNAR